MTHVHIPTNAFLVNRHVGQWERALKKNKKQCASEGLDKGQGEQWKEEDVKMTSKVPLCLVQIFLHWNWYGKTLAFT